MKRFISHDLEQWRKSRRRKPLILRGARQVGKTYSARRFGETRFKNFLLVDLERNPGWHKVFEGNLQAKQICSDLEILLNQKIIPGKTLLFFDEFRHAPGQYLHFASFMKIYRSFMSWLPALFLNLP